MTERKLYLYAIIDGNLTTGFIDETCGYRINILAEGELSIACSRAALDEYGELRKIDIIAHHAVVVNLFRRFTLLPIRYGTLIEGETAARELLSSNKKQFKWQLHKLRDKVEMGVKVLWDPKWAGNELPASEISRDSIVQQLELNSPGHKFLLQKYLMEKPKIQIRQLAEQLAARIHPPLAALAEEARPRLLRTPALMYSGVYLVTRSNIPVFREEYALLKSRLKNLGFMMSGPWPPYSFAKITCRVGSE